MMDGHKGFAITEFVLRNNAIRSSRDRARLLNSWKQVQGPQDNHGVRTTSLMRRSLLGITLRSMVALLLPDSKDFRANLIEERAIMKLPTPLLILFASQKETVMHRLRLSVALAFMAVMLLFAQPGFAQSTLPPSPCLNPNPLCLS